MISVENEQKNGTTEKRSVKIQKLCIAQTEEPLFILCNSVALVVSENSLKNSDCNYLKAQRWSSLVYTGLFTLVSRG
jgi:hypothetical protein